MNQHLTIRVLAKQTGGRTLNEADTRADVIDDVLEKVLDWPKGSIKRETFVHPGFADYLLHNAAGQVALVVEAKKEGSFFHLPKRSSESAGRPDYVSVRTLLTDPTIKEALLQVREYCSNLGCNFGCITNGHEWIVFRVFETGVDWRTLRAFVIPSLDAIDLAFTQVYNALSYRCVSHDGSLNTLLSRTPHDNRETYRAGHEIPAYTRIIQANKYVQYLRPIADRFFGEIQREQSELMNECYVSNTSFDSAFRSAQSLVTDSLTPYLQEFGIRDTKNDDGGGTFGNRIERSLTRDQRAEVVVLFGGKGIGKSTFLRRLLFTRPPQILKKTAVVVLVDLLNVPEIESEIDAKIWQETIRQLDIDNILSSDRPALLDLFSDRFEIAKRQELFGFAETSQEFNRSLNALVAKWKADDAYVASRLRNHLRKMHKGVVLVIDNTDQYPTLQEHCFTRAQQLSKTLGGLVIVSMREERFYASSIRGVLDAFQSAGFHLSSPPPENVFVKRLEYVQKILASESRRVAQLPQDIPQPALTTVQALIRNFTAEFRNPQSHLASFLSACAHGNIRLALELFRGMLQSRYTNIDEITAGNNWTWQLHQVLKPVMIPNRFFYEESGSHVPNIFQLRSKKRSSHFTTLRMLSALVNYSEIQGAAFLSLAQLLTEFSNRFHMEDDQKVSVDILLKYGLIESSNRIDKYSEDIDSVRCTAYGRHLINDLASAFTYLDLVSTDTAVFDAAVASEIAALGMSEYEIWERSYFDPAKRIERVEKRITKTLEFVAYLEGEEAREADLYSLTPVERFMPRIRMRLESELESVRRSAKRQRFR